MIKYQDIIYGTLVVLGTFGFDCGPKGPQQKDIQEYWTGRIVSENFFNGRLFKRDEYHVKVEMDDGSLKVFEEIGKGAGSLDALLDVGDSIKVEGSRCCLRIYDVVEINGRLVE